MNIDRYHYWAIASSNQLGGTKFNEKLGKPFSSYIIIKIKIQIPSDVAVENQPRKDYSNGISRMCIYSRCTTISMVTKPTNGQVHKKKRHLKSQHTIILRILGKHQNNKINNLKKTAMLLINANYIIHPTFHSKVLP